MTEGNPLTPEEKKAIAEIRDKAAAEGDLQVPRKLLEKADDANPDLARDMLPNDSEIKDAA